MTSQTTPNYWSKAGLMMRQDLTAGSAHVSVALLSQANRVQTLQRSSAGGTTSAYNSNGGAAPVWLKLERVGSTITSFRSTDGVNWTQLQSLSTTMSGTIYVGLAVTSRVSGQLSTAVFEDVSVTGGGGSPTATPTNTPVPTNTPSPTPTNPGSTATPTNTPTPTPTPPPGGATIQRVTFMFAGQAIAVKVSGDPTSSNNGIFYFHNDHLGSTSVLTKDSDGYVLGSSVVRYYPFGGYRDTGEQELTDRGYTGHKENLDVGLIYMNARYYVPYINRFASADTIVPDATNPQSLNRYSYARNNPVNRIDPSGHVDCDLETGVCIPGNTTLPSPPALVNFTADVDTEVWSDAEKNVIREGAMATAIALARQINQNNWQTSQRFASMGENYRFTPIQPRDAFFAVFGEAVTFNKTGTACGGNGCFGESVGNRTIDVYTDIYDANNNSRIPNNTTGARWAIHELGHIFESTVNGNLVGSSVRNILGEDSSIDRRPNNGDGTYGFAGPRFGWQQSGSGTTGEEFADMFIGWTYNQWQTTGIGAAQGRARADFMSRNMPLWVDLTVNQ